MKKLIFITENDLYEDGTGIYLYKGDLLVQIDSLQSYDDGHMHFRRLRDNKFFDIMIVWLENPNHPLYIKHRDISNKFENLKAIL